MTDVDCHIRQGEMMLRLCETLVQHAVAGWCAKPTTGGNPWLSDVAAGSTGIYLLERVRAAANGAGRAPWLDFQYHREHQEARIPAAAFLPRERNARAVLQTGGFKDWPCKIDARLLAQEAAVL
jgi:hypothetical protein